jgi:hypothetical protein
MSTAEQQIHSIGISIDKAKETIELAEALQRLHQNADFKKVILEELFKVEAARAVLLKTDPGMLGDEQQQTTDNIIITIGGVYQFFGKIYRLADGALQAISDNEKTRDEIQEEQLGQGELVQ